MSSINEARAVRYLLDSSNDLTDADIMLEKKRYSTAAFLMEQSCEKATKACLALLGIIGIRDHSITSHVEEDLIPEAAGLEDEYESKIKFLRKIESFYISARYGVGTDGRIRMIIYNEAELNILYASSKEYVQLCFHFVEERIGIVLPQTPDDLMVFFTKNYSSYIARF